MKDVKWLLFDLGGVLVEYVGAERMRAWLPRPMDEWELSRLWLFSPSVRAFESGQISPVIFAYNIIGELGLRVHPDDFLLEFPDFVQGWYTGAALLLSELSASHPLALLSNTNSLQWNKLCSTSYNDKMFRKLFLSFKTGFLKPDVEAYENVVEKLGCKPEEILFFDDNPANVRGALDVGINAVHVMGFEDLGRKVSELGLLH